VKSKKTKKDWAAQLQQWAAPFLRALGHPAQRRWAPVYLTGLLGPVTQFKNVTLRAIVEQNKM